MYNVQIIKQRLFGLVGSRQPINPDYAILDADNTTSRSGRFITDNPFAKIEFMRDNTDYKLATALQFNAALRNKQESAIIQVMDKVFSEPDYIDRQLLYSKPNNKTQTENLPDGFIGLELRPCTDKTWAFEISRVITEFEGFGTITLMLFNSNSKLPLMQQDIDIISDVQETQLNWRLFNHAEIFKGKFYLGYLNQGLTVKPFKRVYECANEKNLITGLGVDEIMVPDHDDSMAIFDLLNVKKVGTVCGLNPDITVYNDYTNVILNNEQLFANAIQLQFTIDVLSEYLASLRFNMNQRTSEDLMQKILVELEGIDVEDGIKKAGLKRELMGSINHLRKETKRIYEGYFASGFMLNIQ